MKLLFSGGNVEFPFKIEVFFMAGCRLRQVWFKIKISIELSLSVVGGIKSALIKFSLRGITLLEKMEK